MSCSSQGRRGRALLIPQGALGGWLIVVCRQVANGLPRGLRRLGIVAGVGLALVSSFPIGYALFVDPAILHGPVGDDDRTPPGTDRANQVVHIALAIGTLIGCSTYPIWSALSGRCPPARESVTPAARIRPGLQSPGGAGRLPMAH